MEPPETVAALSLEKHVLGNLIVRRKFRPAIKFLCQTKSLEKRDRTRKLGTVPIVRRPGDPVSKIGWALLLAMVLQNGIKEEEYK